MSVDEERRLSLPAHFWRWDVKRAATLRVLGYLWSMGDYAETEIWCFHTDAEVIEGCRLSGERLLRKCLLELREAGLVMRETGSEGRPGFRLYNREPFRPEVAAARSGRPEVAAIPARSGRTIL